MSKKRGRLEVIYDILHVIRENNNTIRPTPLLRYSNLSTQRFNTYIKELIAKSFVKEITDKQKRKHFTLTDKGFTYLQKYNTIVDFIEYFEL